MYWHPVSLQALEDLGVEGLGPGAGGQLPGDVEVAGLQGVAELQGPLAPGDGGQVREVDVLDLVVPHVAGDLVGHLVGVPHDVAGGPHLRRRAEGALVRAAPRGQDRHRAAVVHAPEVGEGQVLVDRELVPGRRRDLAELAAAGSTGPCRMRPRRLPRGGAREAMPWRPAIERPVAHPVDQLDGGGLALAEHAVVDGVGLLEHPGPERRGVVAADHDRRRPGSAALIASTRSRSVPHSCTNMFVMPDHAWCRGGSGRDLVDRQADAAHPPGGGVEVLELLDGLAHAVDHVDLVAGVPQDGGDVGQPDGRHRAPEREALGHHHHVGPDQGHPGGLRSGWACSGRGAQTPAPDRLSPRRGTGGTGVVSAPSTGSVRRGVRRLKPLRLMRMSWSTAVVSSPVKSDFT